MLVYYPPKFNDHSLCKSGDKTINVCPAPYKWQRHYCVQGYSRCLLVYHSTKLGYYRSGKSVDKVVNICLITYRWWRHCHVQVKVSACWYTILPVDIEFAQQLIVKTY